MKSTKRRLGQMFHWPVIVIVIANQDSTSCRLLTTTISVSLSHENRLAMPPLFREITAWGNKFSVAGPRHDE
jgi:hypothetical protein